MTGSEYRAIREQMGMTQKELGDRLGLHQTVISKREAGKNSISREAARAIRSLQIEGD